MMTGVEIIAAERKRQIEEEGWTTKGDLVSHPFGDLSEAAICYTQHAADIACGPDCDQWDDIPEGWPWHPRWWKPSNDPVRDLAKAGALIAAEIDRLQRAAGGNDEY